MIGLNKHDCDIVNHSGLNQFVTAWSIFDSPQGGTTFFRSFWLFSIAKNSKKLSFATHPGALGQIFRALADHGRSNITCRAAQSIGWRQI